MTEDSYAIKRGGPRVSLIAAAQIAAHDNGTPLNVRVPELSARGCYIDSLNPFDVGVEVHLRIAHKNPQLRNRWENYLLARGLRDGRRLPESFILDAWLAEGAVPS